MAFDRLFPLPVLVFSTNILVLMSLLLALEALLLGTVTVHLAPGPGRPSKCAAARLTTATIVQLLLVVPM